MDEGQLQALSTTNEKRGNTRGKKKKGKRATLDWMKLSVLCVMGKMREKKKKKKTKRHQGGRYQTSMGRRVCACFRATKEVMAMIVIRLTE